MLYHITSDSLWSAAQASGELPIPEPTEGFIHCSYAHQVVRVANERFAGRGDLVLLVIDPARVPGRIIDEDLYQAGERFPHIYGPLPASAVVAALPLRPYASGRFSLPPGAAAH